MAIDRERKRNEARCALYLRHILHVHALVINNEKSRSRQFRGLREKKPVWRTNDRASNKFHRQRRGDEGRVDRADDREKALRVRLLP